MKVRAPDTSPDSKFVDEWLHSLTGSGLTLVKRDFQWIVFLECSVVLSVQSLWRIRGVGGLLCTSEDDGQIFGLPAPVKADEKANALLKDATVLNGSIDESTGDLQFDLSGAMTFEVLTNSTGYESWQMSRGAELIVSRNGGLVIFSGGL